MCSTIGRPIHADRDVVLPDDVKTPNELICHLVEDERFEDEEDVRIFLRKKDAHQLTPKGRLWELAGGGLNFRCPGPEMDKVEREDGTLVVDWVVNDKDFAIALMDNGIEETGSVLGTSKQLLTLALFAHIWFRGPKTEQEEEQVRARAYTGVST
jgi:hypothetical protein